jgi:hypothetical protein
MRRALLGSVGAFCVLGSWLGCTSILGISDPKEVPFPSEGGAASEAGASDAAAQDDAFLDDPNNCGSLGHVCNAGTGASCNGGLCNYTIATEQRPVYGLAVSSGTVFWVVASYTNGSVAWCPTTGCAGGVPNVIAQNLMQPQALALDQTNLYWTMNAGMAGDIESCPRTGGCTIPRDVGQESQPPNISIVVNQSSVYFISDLGIRTCSTDGDGGPCTGFYAVGGNAFPVWLATNGQELYWTDGTSNNVLACILGAPCTTPMVLYNSGSATPGAIAADTQNVYFTDAVPDPSNTNENLVSIKECPLSGCGANLKILATNQPGIGGDVQAEILAVDADNVYWVNTAQNGSIMKCAIAGCGGSPTILSADQVGPSAIAIDDQNVYWSNADGTIRFVPK